MAEAENPFVEFVQTFHHDPVAFVRNVLKIEPDPWQSELLESVAAGNRRISVR